MVCFFLKKLKKSGNKEFVNSDNKEFVNSDNKKSFSLIIIHAHN
jgi:hypothetical protein